MNSPSLLLRRLYSAKRSLPTVQQSIAAARAGQGQPSPTTEPSPSSSSSSPSSSSSHQQNHPYVPKFLDRPLGVEQKPSSRPLTNREKAELLYNQELRMKERRRLIREISKGYYSDIHDFRDHGGKLWVAPDTLIREEKSLYFPDFQGRSLSGDKHTHTCDLFDNKVTLVAIGSNLIAEEHISSYKTPILNQYEDNPNFQVVQINIQESKMKYFVAAMMMSTLKRSISPKYHPTYLLVNSPMSVYEESLNCKNRYVGYVFLVDWNGKVRWAACGYPAGANIQKQSTSSDKNSNHKNENDSETTTTSQNATHSTPLPSSSSSSAPPPLLQNSEQNGGEVESLARCIGVLLKRLPSTKTE